MRKNTISNKTSSGSKKSSKKKTDTLEKSTDTKNAVDEIEFPVVGIGASAGGLEAFSALLKSLPADTGMAFVLVQHLAPSHESMLTELLARSTAMPITEITDGLSVEANHVYVIPPNVNLGILHGVLHLVPREVTPAHYLPIDNFLRSLAADMGSKAIGVILSGTASDGVLGLKEIKAVGGITFAQDEESASYNGMPHSAIAAGCVDFILPPAEIAAELARLRRHPYYTVSVKGIETLPEGDQNLGKIFLLLRQHTGTDFTYYKTNTIQRRIKRRMLLNKIDKIEDYVRYLHRTPREIDALFHDMLIHVTGFFRDPQVFEELAQTVFPELMKERPPELPIRIWIPGCSTGEEVYSIAISLLEFLGENANFTPIQIFATDLDEQAIEQARQAIYPESISETVSIERLRKFFIKVEQGYEINKNIRDLCIFSKQNVLKDPPFSKLDLISCRNLLIYLGAVLQKKVLPIFHYALKANGFLLLGSSETIGRFADLFRMVDKKHKIYSKKATPSELHFDFAGGVGASDVRTIAQSRAMPLAGDNFDLHREVDRLLLNKFAPPGVVVNDELEILQFRGHTGPFLEPAPGEASLKLLKMARDGLQAELHGAMNKSIKSNLSVRREGIRFYTNGDSRVISVEVDPIKVPSGSGKFYLITFQQATPEAEEGKSKPMVEAATSIDSDELKRLRDELAASKEYLNAIIEQQEVSNEELTSANEEIQASNEELQSINEELETAKEELQSTNEELVTVNDELESRNAELALLNNDLSNLIGGLSTSIIMVDKELRIRRYSPEAEKSLGLLATDRGQPISYSKLHILIPDLEQRLMRVIDTITADEIEVQAKDGHWYKVQLRPYKTEDKRIDGAVLAYYDVNDIKQSLALAEQARDYAESIVASIRDPLLVLDNKLRVVSASAAFYETFKVTRKETVGNLLYRLGNGQWGIPRLRQELETALENKDGFDEYMVEHDFDNIGHRIMNVSGRAIAPGLDDSPMVLMQIEDITEKSLQGSEA